MSKTWTDFILSMCSSIPVGVLATWIGKVWANRISRKENQKNTEEIEKIKSKLLVQQNVFKIQFEKEFEIYQKLCTITANIRNCLGTLIHRKNNTKEDENKTREDALNNFNAFIELVNSQEAFMSESVYQHCSMLLSMICSLDNENIKHDEAFYRKLDKDTKELFTVIRTRLNSLNVQE